jgi:hypothetical protein
MRFDPVAILSTLLIFGAWLLYYGGRIVERVRRMFRREVRV